MDVLSLAAVCSNAHNRAGFVQNLCESTFYQVCAFILVLLVSSLPCTWQELS